jgi:hypothetical protein
LIVAGLLYETKDGLQAYKGILLFKMLLIEIWYGLSNERVEDVVNDSLSAMIFVIRKNLFFFIY